MDSSKAARKFLSTFGEVSKILEINGKQQDFPVRVLSVEDNIDFVDKPSEVFIKIVTSLQMNTNDPGLRYLNSMSLGILGGRKIDDVVMDLSSENINDVVELCTTVLRGMRYILRDNPGKVYTEHVSLTESFVRYMKSL